MLCDLGIFFADAPPFMLVDSEPAIAMSRGSTHRSSPKHIDLTLALACAYVQRWGVVMLCCPTAEQIAAMWTKQLGHGTFFVFQGSFMGIVPFMRS